MTTGATGQLGLALPVQGELSGTWGNTVNNGITEYTNIAIAATLTLTNDGAVTLANTTGDASASNIVSSLTGAGTVTAQFAIVRVTGTLTTPKIITAPSYSKTYIVVNAATGSTVSFIRSGQTPAVSIAVGESAYVYYNGTDYVKLSSTVATGVTSFTAGTTGLTPATTTTGAVTLAGTLAVANGGTNASTASITSFNNITGFTASGATGTTSTNLVFSTSPTLVTPALGTPTSGTLSNCTVDGTNAVGYRNIPRSGAAKTTSYTLTTGDVGEFIQLDTGGSLVVPDATFANGDVVVILNNTASAITLTMSITTAYIAGTATDKDTMSLAPVGVANILFVSGTTCVVTGNVT